MTLPIPRLVTSNAELAEVCARCATVPAIAVDTEFMRTDTFYPKLGLIQICDGETVWLIDPLEVDQVAPLAELLENPEVAKVFHSCSEDLEVLQSCYGVVPAPLFDTQVAAAFLGYGFSRGYANLVQDVLDLQLDKHETRSDWLQRPLSDSQCLYAAEDVHYLMQVYRLLRDKLEVQGRMAWLKAEMAELVDNARSPNDPELYYRKIKGAWKFSLTELVLLRDMACWREAEARASNRPRNRIVSDKSLLDLVRIKPASRQQLGRIEGLHPQTVRRYGEKLLEFVSHYSPAADTAGIDPMEAPLDREARLLLSGCRDIVDKRAQTLGLAPEILARKKDLEALVRSKLDGAPALPAALASGWRRDIIGEELLQHVH